MKLSVIITSYKFKEYITDCIDSVLSQKTDFGFEVIVRDDGSNDGTYEMLIEKYGNVSNFKLLDSSTNVGAVENLLILMKETKGKYVAHLDGDDYLIDFDYYQRAVDFLDNNISFSMYCSGCKYLEDGTITPENHWIVSAKTDIELKDMLVENYVSFARVFRKTEFRKESFEGIAYPDWVFNFEIMKNGNARCDADHCVGLYRMHANGMYSLTSNEQKLANKSIMQIELTKRYNLFQRKTITIIDSFVYNDTVRDKLLTAVKWMKEDGHEILLVSNTSVDKEILGYVKFYLYDSRNQLFQKKYEDVGVVDFWKYISDGFHIHDVVPVLQKHGLSVMVNLFNAITYAKAQGYTHFQRFEVDDIFSEHARRYIKNVPQTCIDAEKNGLFYYNEDHNPPDISFHYFYCSIDEFLAKVPRISNENDYADYLEKWHGKNKFKIVEVYVHENLKRNGDGGLLIKDGKSCMFSDFRGTHWNTETSISSFDSKYGKCTTRLYNVNEFDSASNSYNRGKTYIVLTYSYHSSSTTRRINVELENGNFIVLNHSVGCAGGWSWNEVPDITKSISVYEDERFLYKEYVKDCISHIDIKR